MTDLSPAPTPTNEQQDARERVARAMFEAQPDVVRRNAYRRDAGYPKPVEWTPADERFWLTMADAALAAVSAAAPDERAQWRDEADLRRASGEFRSAREAAAFVAGAAYRAALASRPAPVVASRLVVKFDGGRRAVLDAETRQVVGYLDGPEPVVSGEDVREFEWGMRQDDGRVVTLRTEDHARTWVKVHNDHGIPRTLVRRTVTPWTVADTPATADDEGGQE